jgi:hypothetical protein
VAVSPVDGRRDIRQWLDLPGQIQGSDPHWVAPLRFDQKNLIDRRKNSFFRVGDAQLFLARSGGRPVGRISAHTALPMAGLETAGLGSFGFFESRNDPAIAKALLAAAGAWLAGRGATRIIGPMNFSMNHECGLLVDGFDSPPFLLMPHNPPWYAGLLEQAGCRKLKDLLAWRFNVGPFPERLERLAERVRRAHSLHVRQLDPRRFADDARTVLSIFNAAWSRNWGFTPMRPDEFDEAIRELRQIVDPRLVLIAESGGRPAAIAVSLPNLNEAIAGLDGRLLPFGFVKLLYRLKYRRPRTARCLMLGIEESHRGFSNLGLSVLLYKEMNEAARRCGVEWGELSWTLEDNEPINAAIRATGATIYKTYRIYEKDLRP